MNSVNDDRYLDGAGPFEARYLTFLETIGVLYLFLLSSAMIAAVSCTSTSRSI